jgi:MFS family permease
MIRYTSAIAINISVFLFMIGVGMIVSILPRKIILLTGSGSEVGYLASAFAVSYVLIQVPLGYWADRRGYRLFLSTGYFLCCLTGLLYYRANRPEEIFLGRLIQGLGEAPIWALAPAMLSIQFARDKGKIIGTYNALLHLGLTIGPLLGLLLFSPDQENYSFLLFAFLGFTGGILTILFVTNPEALPGTLQQKPDSRRGCTFLKERGIPGVFLGIMLYGTGYGLSLTVIPAYLYTIKEFSRYSIGLYFTLFYVMISLTQTISGFLSDRKGRTFFMAAGLLGTAVGFNLFFQRDQAGTFILLALASFGLGSFSVSSMAFLHEKVPDSLKGTLSGAYYLFWGLGFFLGPIIFGIVPPAGLGNGFRTLSLLLVLEALFLVLLAKERRDPLSRTPDENIQDSQRS